MVGRPGGGALVTVASAVPQATQCDGSAGRSFRPALPFGGGWTAPPARRSRSPTRPATASTAPFPVASFQTAHARLQRDRCTCATCRPAARRRSRTAARCRRPLSPRARSTAARSPRPAAPVTVTATIGGTPFRAVLSPQPFAAEVSVADGATAVTVHGADPAGGAVGDRPDGAWRGVARAHIGDRRAWAPGWTRPSTLPLAAPPGRRRQRRAGRWSTSTRLGSAAFTGDGFTVSIPASAAGCAGAHSCVTGTLRLDARLPRPGGRDEHDGCARAMRRARARRLRRERLRRIRAGTARTAVTADGGAARGGRQRTVDLTEPSLGTSSLRIAADGVRGSLDDGGLHVRGTPRQPVVAAISSPRGALPSLRATRTVLTRKGGRCRPRAGSQRVPAPRGRRRDGQPERRRRRVGARRVPLPPRRRRWRDRCSRAAPRPAHACSSRRARAPQSIGSSPSRPPRAPSPSRCTIRPRATRSS